MAKLQGQSIASSFDQVVIVDDASGVTASLQALEGAATGGGVSALKIATNKVEVIPSAADDANAFEVSKADGTAIITADPSAETVDMAGHDGSTKGLKLGGTLVTSDASELNILDGVTADKDELNILDGVTATNSELNVLAGATGTTYSTISSTSNIIMDVAGTTQKKDVDELAEYYYNHFCRVGTVSLWNASSAYGMSNTSGADLSNCDAPFNPDDFNDTDFDMKLCMFLTANSASSVNFQLQYDDTLTSGNVAIPETGWTYTTMASSGIVYESPVVTVSLVAATQYRFKLHGWVDANSASFNNAYFWVRPRT